MRNGLLIAGAGIALVCSGICWYMASRPINDPVDLPNDDVPGAIAKNDNHDGNAEASDVIEPLVVGHVILPTESARTPVGEEWVPRVILMNGMQQPPRPDEDGQILRMPYAEE